MMQRLTRLFTMSLMLLIGLSACNLGASGSAPPTLAPLATMPPPPTLGVASAFGTPQSQFEPSNINTPVPDTDLEIFSIMNQVETDRLMEHIARLQGFHTRHVNSSTTSETTGIGAARRYIADEFRKIQQASNGRLYTFPHEFTITIAGMTTLQHNVVAVIQGTEAGAGTLVVGAHYDSIVVPDFNDGESFAPGANDNASGVAAIIEIARILSQRPMRASVMLVAFSAEEVNRLGSRAFVQYLKNQNIDVFGMINIDGIGNERDRRGNVNNTELRLFSSGPNTTSTSRHMARTAEFIGYTHSLPLKLVVEDAPDREGRYGDHFSFSEAGIPAFRFIQVLEQKINGDPTDTIEYISPQYLRTSVQTILMVVLAMADGPPPPRNITLREQDSGTSSLVWEAVPDVTTYIVALRWRNGLNYDQQIQVTGNSISWDGFRNYEGIAVSAVGKNGIVGPLSAEYRLP